jgi:hypothetical protein
LTKLTINCTYTPKICSFFRNIVYYYCCVHNARKINCASVSRDYKHTPKRQCLAAIRNWCKYNYVSWNVLARQRLALRIVAKNFPVGHRILKCLSTGCIKKRRPLGIKHIVKIWMPFQLHICWTVVREILMECIY